ncbi:MAG: phospholipid transport system substrate-binding protein [Thiomicrorhabdus sp.]|nr:MAG: phospholipid transport system substrate-binding protein [Thiomicrorhabdus sp.]
MLRNQKIITALLGGIVLLFSMQLFAETIPRDDPGKMVLVLSQVLVSTINERREELESHPASVKQFANEYVLPYLDTKKMARYVMGKYWRTASEQQQGDFVEVFSNTLIRSYSKSLLKLQIEDVVVRPAKETKPGRATIASVVTQSDGNRTDVVYRAYLNKKVNHWMLYDVAIEGISMLLNYRKAYGSDFSKKGIDAVIAEMQKKNLVLSGSN